MDYTGDCTQEFHLTLKPTYIHLELVHEPGQVEVEVAALHEHGVPAGKLGDDAGRHVLDELVLAVQQVEERLPVAALVAEDLHAGLVLLEFKVVLIGYNGS